MNNEPVAWTACLDCGQRVTGDSIHTCSPQLKTLTDEEIKSEAKYFCHSYHSENPERLVLFARAILRKAQEADKIESLGTVNIGGVHYRNGKPEK